MPSLFICLAAGLSAGVIPIAIGKLKRLKMRLPPRHLFDELLGCSGNRRFISLYWSRAVRAPILNDGFLSTLGEPDPYRVWRHHPGVVAVLAGFNLGDAADTAGHWLLVDRKLRVLYIGAPADVSVILDYQKRGVTDSLPETLSMGKTDDSKDIQGESGIVPTKKYKKNLMLNLKQLHELENWLDANVTGD